MNFNKYLWLASVCKHFPKQILTLRYFIWTHEFINWENPKDLQQYVLKTLFDAQKSGRLQELADLADKVKVREFVADRIGEQYLPELYGVWKSPDEIDFSALPQSFVIKTNNGCGTNVIVPDKSIGLDEASIRKSLNKWLKFPYGDLTGQIHYSLIPPKVFAESYLKQDANKKTLPFDYKFFCFNGKPKFILYFEGRKANGHIAQNMVFDLKWRAMPNAVLRPIKHDIPCPKSLETMIEIACKLSAGFDFVRVDLYEIDEKPIFGEMTFTPATQAFTPDFIQIKNFPYLG